MHLETVEHNAGFLILELALVGSQDKCGGRYKGRSLRGTWPGTSHWEGPFGGL
jgi:hypothetical protein